MAIYDYSGNEIMSGSENKFEPKPNDIPIVTITGELYSTKAEGDSNVVISYKSATLEFTDYAKAKVQGDSSQWYAKKNYTIKLFSDVNRSKKSKRLFRNWDEERNKFVLKANWIDHSHARNIVNARLWSQVMKARPDYAQLPQALRDGNLAIDGFPVKVFNNGVYMGIYTWNLPKDSLYGLDSDIDSNCIIQSDGDPNTSDLSMFFAASAINNAWSDELHDTMPSVINTNWTSILQFINESSDSDFVAQIGNHIDVLSLIDVHIFIQLTTLMDQIGKNQTFFTYNASKWYHSMYDMDGSWGLKAWNPAEGFKPTDFKFQESYYGYSRTGYGNKLHKRLTDLFSTDIASRYSQLRTSVLSEDNIVSEFEKFMGYIPPYLYAEDAAETTGGGAFTEIPLASEDHLRQIRDYVPKRLAYIDANLK